MPLNEFRMDDGGQGGGGSGPSGIQGAMGEHDPAAVDKAVIRIYGNMSCQVFKGRGGQ